MGKSGTAAGKAGLDEEAAPDEAATEEPVSLNVNEPQDDATVEGYIDGLDSRWHVVGWARSLLDDAERLRLELLDGNRMVSTDVASRFRGDLVDAGRGDGCAGFQLTIPASLFDGQRHQLTVRAAQPGGGEIIGRISIVLPSRVPKSARLEDMSAQGSAARMVGAVLGNEVAQPAKYMETYQEHLTSALRAVARDYDMATALGLLYVHILRRRIDEGGLQSRLTRLSINPDQLGDVVREVVESDEAQNWLKKPGGYHLPDLEAIWIWTRPRPIH